MRISSLQIFNIANNSMANASEAIAETQAQLSTGRRVLRPSDDPVASTKILSLTEELATTEQYKKNINIAKNDLVIEEATLDASLNVLQRIQELAVQAGNTATLSPSEYKSLADEVDARLDEMRNLLNTQNASGDFIFGGYKSTSEPFVGDASRGFRYMGDEGQKFIKVANNTFVPSSDSGKAIFVDVESERANIQTYAGTANRSQPPAQISIGTVTDRETFDAFAPKDMVLTFNQDSAVVPAAKNFTVTERATGRVIIANQVYNPGEDIIASGVSIRITGNPTSATPTQVGDRFFIESTDKQDVLTTMARFSEAMRNVDGSSEKRIVLTETINDTLQNLKFAQTSILEVTSKIGARFNTLESTEELHTDSSVVLQELLSELRDVNYAEASTKLSSQTLILQAAQASFIRVSQLSLFTQL